MPQTRLVGSERLARTLREAGADLSDLRDTNRQVAAFVTSRARPLAPRGRGTLAATGRPGATKRAAVIRFGNNSSVRYARAVHGGRYYPSTGHRVPARPWASFAAQNSEQQWSQMYADAVGRVLNTIRGI